jgi:uncharacterized protein (TIGR03437 family)
MKKLTACLFLLTMLLGFAHEAKPSTLLYAMTESGLLYRSTDGAKTWKNMPLPGAPEPAQFSAFAVDPENSSNLYVSVSPADKVLPGDPTSYFFISSDSGATWTLGSPPAAAGLLAVDPTKSNIVYLGSTGSSGLFRSTDSGVTWSATPISTNLTGISPDAHHAGVVYVTTHDGEIHKSTDSGATWTVLPGSLPSGFNRLLSVTVDPSNSSVLWGTGEGSCLANGLGFSCGLVHSSDGGQTWQTVGSVKGWFKNVVIDPRNGTIYAAGKDTSAAPKDSTLMLQSTDGGATWTSISNGLSTFGAEVHLDPTTASTLYASQANLPGTADLGPGGGVYVTTNGGTSWTLNPVDASQGQRDLVFGFAAVTASVVTGPPPPSISSSGVVNGASFQPGIVPDSWVTILGTNLASKTDDWSNAIVNGQFPTKLDGVSVEVGGKLAYVYFISTGQINVLAPDVGFGSLPLTVTTTGGTSATFTVTSSQYGPAFFEWPNNQPVATRQDFSYAVKDGTFAGTTTVAAKPGDVLILWGTGFGPTNPVAPPGAAVPSDTTYLTTTLPTVTINNIPATVYGGALTPGFAGLYQIAIQVPASITDGDWPIQAEIGGAQSPASVLLSVQQ